MRGRREKVFGPGRAVPLDRNAKARIAAYARAWSARNKQPRQRGPITRAFLEVLEALLWGFHNSRSGVCFPSYEAIAAKAECHRCTVAEALKALEWAGALTWQNRITRAVVRQRDLFGRWSNRWTVIRTSNAYVFRDPKLAENGRFRATSENPIGTPNQEIPGYLRPVLRERIGAQSIAAMDRDAVASRDRQLAALKATMIQRQSEGSKALLNKKAAGDGCAYWRADGRVNAEPEGAGHAEDEAPSKTWREGYCASRPR